MKLEVLGQSQAWSDAGGACSGYLVSRGESKILLDCGNGVFGKLRQRCDYVDVDTIFVSHLHADHFLDLIPFAFALTYAPRQQPVPVGRWPGTDQPARPVLYGPPGSREAFSGICDIWGACSLIDDAFDFREFDPGERIEVGGMQVCFREVPHYVRTWAIEVSGPDGARLTYGADCRPNDALVEFARDTDLLIAEATLAKAESYGQRGHLTPAEAGEHAAAAGARRLLLTHISDELDPAWAVAEAAKAYHGPLEVAHEGTEIEV